MQILRDKLSQKLKAGVVKDRGNSQAFAVLGPNIDDYSFQYLKEVSQLEQG